MFGIPNDKLISLAVFFLIKEAVEIIAVWWYGYKCGKNDACESYTLKNSLNKKMNATPAKYKPGDYVLDEITEERKAEIIEVTATHYVLRDCDDGWQHSVLHDMIEDNYKVEVRYHGPIVN